MLGEILPMPEKCNTSQQVGKCIEMTLLESLESERERAADRLKDLDAAIEALKANPSILQVLQLISKVRRY